MVTSVPRAKDDGTSVVFQRNLKASGTVLVGTVTDDGSGAKLQVAGAMNVAGTFRTSGTVGYTTGHGIEIQSSSTQGFIYAYNRDTSTPESLALQHTGGNVLIGTTTDDSSGAKLQVNGNISVTAAADPAIRLSEANSSTSYTTLQDSAPTQVQFNKVVASGGALMDLNPLPSDGTSSANVRLFRGTNTSGTVSLNILKGDNSSSTNCVLGGNTNCYFNALAGNCFIGTGSDDGSGAKLQVSGLARATLGFGMTLATKANNAAGKAGDIAWDGSYIYVCTADNTWKRAALSTF